MVILNIAEKPSIAKSIKNILSHHSTTLPSLCKITPNYKFTFRETEMIFTSVLGHIFTHDFPKTYSNWSTTNPSSLFEAPIIAEPRELNINVVKNLTSLSSKCTSIIIWTDCDREGEHIGSEISRICLSSNSRLDVKRAHFYAITYSDIVRAMDNLRMIDVDACSAVDCRIELDLRIGSSFTRLQTLRCNDGMGSVLSYGLCQIPTLGLVVERTIEKENFVCEDYYTLKLSVLKQSRLSKSTVKKENGYDVFKWKRGNVFDKNCVVYFQKMLKKEEKECVVESVVNKSTEKIRPLPLRTVELQKACGNIFNINSHEVMNIAEKLYQTGEISYPRTETDNFPEKFEHHNVINSLKGNATYRDYCKKLQGENDSDVGGRGENKFQFPRKGRNNDDAHLPIYPLKSGENLSGNYKRIYDYIARRYLGCVSKNAKGEEKKVEIILTDKTKTKKSKNVRDEYFTISGIEIHERNYLEIFTFDKWEGVTINDYKKGDIIKIVEENSIEINSNSNLNNDDIRVINDSNTLNINKTYLANLTIKMDKTEPPNFLTEPELISLMDKNEIGTDATIAEHIHKIITRKYCFKRDKFIIPSYLGMGIIMGYKEIGLNNLAGSLLRKELEINLKRICDGSLGNKTLIQKELKLYKELYEILEKNIEKINTSINYYKNNDNSKGNNEDESNDSKDNRSNKKTKYKRNNEDDSSDSKDDGSHKGNKKTKTRNTKKYQKNNDTTGISHKENTTKKQKNINEDQIYKKFEKTLNKNKDFESNENQDHIKEIMSRKKSSNNQNRNKDDEISENKDHKNEIKSKNDDQNIICNCNVPAKKGVVSKKKKNKGRIFFSCENWPKGCDFFEWEDEKEKKKIKLDSEEKENKYNIDTKIVRDGSIKCYCGYDVQIKVANTSNNKGRQFQICKKAYKPCKFFEWLD